MSSTAGLPRLVLFMPDMQWMGGIQRVAVTMAGLLADDYEVTILTQDARTGPPVFDTPHASQASLDLAPRTPGLVSTLLTLWRVSRALRSYCRANRVEIVCSFWGSLHLVTALALLGLPVRTVACEHLAYDSASAKVALLRRVLYRFHDAVVSLTEADRSRYEAIARRVAVIPNCTAPVPARPQSDKAPQLLTVGHLIHRKGLDRLLVALAEPLRRAPAWSLVVVGGGTKGHNDPAYLAEVSSLVESLGLSGRVRFHHATAQIEHFYREASLYVSGSRAEGLPMVMIEAKMAGVPCIAYDCPTGPAEIIRHGIDGFLIPDGGAEFGPAALRLMSDPALRQTMADAGRADAETRFSPPVIRQRWLDLLASLPSQ
jgi:amylovoran biosynthesis glycosyltransferase AmsD